MATIVYPVAAFTSGLNVFKRDEENEIVREFIIAEIHALRIRNIRSVDLSYFDRKFGVCAKFVPNTLKPHEKNEMFAKENQ